MGVDVRLHRLGRHEGVCGGWVDVVGEGGEAVVGRVGGVWWKSRGVCRVRKCWEGHGVGEWQRILVGTLALRSMLPSVSNAEVQTQRDVSDSRYNSRCSRQCKLKRQSADDDGIDAAGFVDAGG
jgi:hypothetical protein